MRKFSESEKEYVKAIIDAYKSNSYKKLVLKDLIDSIFKRAIVFNQFPAFEIKEGETDDREKVEGYNNAIKNGYIPIAVFLGLLKQLESNGLITIIPYFDFVDAAIDDGEEDLGHNNVEVVQKNYFSIIDHAYLTFLRRNYYYLIYPTQELIDLNDNKFKTIDDRRFKKQSIFTWVSISVAFIIGIWGIYKPNMPSSINDVQFSIIDSKIENSNERIEKIENMIDSIYFQMRINQKNEKVTPKK